MTGTLILAGAIDIVFGVLIFSLGLWAGIEHQKRIDKAKLEEFAKELQGYQQYDHTGRINIQT